MTPRADEGGADGRGPVGDGAVRRIAVIGVGLMGGSLGLAAREHAGVAEVRGFSQTRATLDLALQRGAITVACDSLEEAAQGADLVFVCTPVRLVVKHVKAALAAAPPDAVISDVGSTKGPLMRALTPQEQERCVGGHPLCGSETAGVGNARASLYEGATYFVTPGDHVSSEAYQRLYGFLGDIGARPVAVDPEEHDRLMAVVSHLPHVLANVLMTQAGAAPGIARRARLRRPQLPRRHPHRRQQPARVDRHLPREPRGPAGRARDLPAGPAGGARGARRQRRRAPRPDHRQGPRPAPEDARRRQPGGQRTAAAHRPRLGPPRRVQRDHGRAGRLGHQHRGSLHAPHERGAGRHPHPLRAGRRRGRARLAHPRPVSGTT